MNEATAALRADLMSADPSVQIFAARRCARAKLSELVDDLIVLGRSPNAEVRAAAWWALDQMRATAAIPQLVAGLEDSDFVARSNAGWALVHIGPEVLPYVEAAAHSANADAREMAGLVLAHLKCEGRTLLGASPVASTSISRREFGGAMNAINNELSVVGSFVMEMAKIPPPDVDVEVRAMLDELREFGERLYVTSTAFNKVLLSFARAEHVDEVARIEVLARARILGDVVTAIDGCAAKLCERPEAITEEMIAVLGDISRCAQKAFQILRLVCARLPLAAL